MDNARWTLNDSIKSSLRQFYDWNEQKSLSPCTYNCIMWLFLGTLRTLISILAKSVIHILLGVSVWNLIGIICLDMSFKHEADTKSMNTIYRWFIQLQPNCELNCSTTSEHCSSIASGQRSMNCQRQKPDKSNLFVSPISFFEQFCISTIPLLFLVIQNPERIFLFAR